MDAFLRKSPDELAPLYAPKWQRQTLLPSISDKFRANFSVVQFEHDSGGKVTGFRLNSPRLTHRR
jgi:hypothetical protein